MFFINFTITTITIGVKYLILIELMSDRRSDRRVIEVIEEGLFFDKNGYFLSIFCAIMSKFASISVLKLC